MTKAKVVATSLWSQAVQAAKTKKLKSAHETNKLAKRLYGALRNGAKGKSMKAAPAKKAAPMKATKKAMKAAPAMKKAVMKAMKKK
ncbi:unnamed protein product [Polarella glacialis]|uniref:Uncharacterized protein n=1 Tax=Polarella glacialis TaxID=89957 RepID=A0A813EHZ1_POLGL|nr:unnamed protein product [Polarella glacialis]